MENALDIDGLWGSSSWDGILNVGVYKWARRLKDRSLPLFKILNYNPQWEIIAQKEINDLKEILSSHGFSYVEIAHVGSTSIPGMPAKPIMQLIIGVDKDFSIRSAINCLFREGWKQLRKDPIMDKMSSYSSDLGVSICFAIHKSTFWNGRIIFRDHFINHPDEINEYAQLKMNSYNLGLSFKEYTRSKQKFFYAVLQRYGFSDEEMLEGHIVETIPRDGRNP